MHWFGELLALYILIAVVIGIPLEIKGVRLVSLRLKSARLAYTRDAAWARTWHQLNDANIAAIDAIERGMAPGFPPDVQEQMLAAHDAASSTMRGRIA